MDVQRLGCDVIEACLPAWALHELAGRCARIALLGPFCLVLALAITVIRNPGCLQALHEIARGCARLLFPGHVASRARLLQVPIRTQIAGCPGFVEPFQLSASQA